MTIESARNWGDGVGAASATSTPDGAGIASVTSAPDGAEIASVSAASGGAEIATVARESILGDAAPTALQRVLLTSDATVVRLLEGFFGEPVRTEGLGQLTRPASPADAELEPAGHETILCRQTLLQGSVTGRNYLYAEAWVVLDRLDPVLREGLLTTSEPIGHLLAANRTETFREVLRLGHKPAGPLGLQFGLEGGDELLSRTYRIVAGGKPIILLTEYFPPLGDSDRGDGASSPVPGSGGGSPATDRS